MCKYGKKCRFKHVLPKAVEVSKQAVGKKNIEKIVAVKVEIPEESIKEKDWGELKLEPIEKPRKQELKNSL